METLRLQTHVGEDGVLKVELPIGVHDVDCDVVIVYTVKAEREGWATLVNRR